MFFVPGLRLRGRAVCLLLRCDVIFRISSVLPARALKDEGCWGGGGVMETGRKLYLHISVTHLH